MLYKNYSIKLWKSEWIGKRINGVWYSLNGYSYLDQREAVKSYRYIALVDQLNPRRAWEIRGASTPLIALDLARFSIDLHEFNWQRFDMLERYRIYDEKCLKERLGK